MNRFSRWFLPLSLLALFLTGLCVRRVVLRAQVDAAGFALPFTLESALNFRRVEEVFAGGRLPGTDAGIQYPEGVVVRENDTVGAEYVYAALARLFPSSVPLAERLRWIEASWFCLGIPLMALWLWWWRRSKAGAAVAAAFYAVALSSVMRSTGQELSHENFALPLLIGHLAFDALARARGRGAGGAGAAAASAVLLAAALATWDLVQFYVFLWAVLFAVRAVRGSADAWETSRGTAQCVVLAAAGALNPYLSAHGFLASPAMRIAYGGLLAAALRRGVEGGRWGPAWGRPFRLAVVGLVPLALGGLAPGPYGEAYGHFAGLLAAKLRFLNRKPADPSLLTFDQRIMWVPALHSANWALTQMLFPAMLWLSLVAIPLLVRRSSDHSDPGLHHLLLLYVASLASFVLFVRFHVFLAVFAAALLGLWAAGSRGWGRAAVMLLLLGGLGVEAARTLREPERWGRGAYYRELVELTDWMERYVRPEPVLANFGVSASIAAYARCPVILHPKFESKAVRERVRSYGEALFSGTEEDFWGWAVGRGAQYYVYALGEFATVAPELQMRYFVDTLTPSTNSAAWRFEFAPESAGHFRFLWGNRKYRVYKVRTPDDGAVAARFARDARGELEKGRLGRAEDRAAAALLLAPANAEAQDVARHAASLREQGFRTSAHERE